MTRTLYEQLIGRFTEVLDEHARAVPGAIPVVVPMRRLAEGALDVLALGRGVPVVPRYDAELAAQRSWHGVRSAEELAETLGFAHVEAVEDDGSVRFTATGVDGQRCEIWLPPNDAEEFAIHLLSAVEAARAGSAVGPT